MCLKTVKDIKNGLMDKESRENENKLKSYSNRKLAIGK